MPILTAPNDVVSQSQNPIPIRVVPQELCPLCGCDGGILYRDLVDWLFNVAGNWKTRYCSFCGVSWLDPQPTAADIQKLYSNYCTHSDNGRLTGIGQLRHAMSEWALARLGYQVSCPKGIVPRLLSHLPSVKRTAVLSVLAAPTANPGTLLDVGCGNGQFISRMRSFGWTVSGIDPDPIAVSQGRGHGLEILCGTIADLPDDASYDVITLSHVLEHVTDPVELLRECRKRLRPGTGRLMITTPNIKSLGHRWFKKCWRGLEVPRHFVLFSPPALRDCVARAGLSLRAMSTETRLAPMIYRQSACAKSGALNVGELIHFKVKTRIAAHLFHGIEDLLVRLNEDVGEEIFCVCTAPIKS